MHSWGLIVPSVVPTVKHMTHDTFKKSQVDSIRCRDQPLNLWAICCSHVGNDIRHNRESLADAIRQSEGQDPASPGFDWDIAVNLGDHSGSQGLPDDDEGREVVRQYAAMQKHDREQVYDIAGNHDRSDIGQPEGWWTDKWIDPAGTHTEFSGVNAAKRPYAVTGNWERYSFNVGNILFLMMSDRNEPSHQLPRSEGGGNPGGVVTDETFKWWKDQVLNHSDKIIITAHHYMLKETTIASGDWEGCWKDDSGKIHQPYHGYKPRGTPQHASQLCYVDGKLNSGAFEKFLEQHPAATSLWLGGHTHAHPDDTTGNKSHIQTRWGTHFLNVSALTQYHAGKAPLSRLFTFTPGSKLLKVSCYLHNNIYAPQGFYHQAQRTLQLPHAFEW